MRKLKVLMVDDSSAMRKIVERALRHTGLDIAEVLEASNGAEALAEAQKELGTQNRPSSTGSLSD